MKRPPQVAMLNEDGSEHWSGSLHEYLKVNASAEHGGNGMAEVREMIQRFRDSFRPEWNNRHEPVIVGGGAAPIFMLMLLE